MIRIDLGLGAVCLALLGLTAWRLEEAMPAPAAAAVPPPAALADAPVPFAPPPLAEFTETFARPLFSPRRRIETPVAVVPPPRLQLVGTVLERNRRLALIRAGDNPAVQVLAEGRELQGMRITTIEADRVILDAPTGRIEIRLPERPQPDRPQPDRPQPDRPEIPRR